VCNTFDRRLDNTAESLFKVLRCKGAVGIDDEAIVLQSNTNGVLQEGIIARPSNLDLEVAQGCFPELSRM
jgi:hypothetical protein